jgi:hypothetical protein
VFFVAKSDVEDPTTGFGDEIDDARGELVCDDNDRASMMASCTNSTGLIVDGVGRFNIRALGPTDEIRPWLFGG